MTRAIGIDVSQYQGEMDFNVAQAAGAKFAIVRCGGGYMNSGIPFTDDRWLENLAKLQSGSLPCLLTGISSRQTSRPKRIS